MHRYADTQTIVRRAGALIAGCALAIALVAPWSFSYAATITVNTNSASSVVGQCALVDAIEAANFNNAVNGCAAGTAGADTIVFSNAVSTISIMSPQLGTNDAFRVIEPLTIDGGGGSFTSAESGLTNMVRIERNNAATAGFRLLSLRAAVTLRNLEIARGAITVPLGPTFDPFVEGGGCVASNAALTLNNVVLADCQYSPTAPEIAYGGALYSSAAVVGSGVIVTRNLASSPYTTGGGGAYVSTSATFTDSVFTANNSIGATASGGGIYAATLTLNDTTVSDNSARGDGYVSGNSTVFGVASGGGVTVNSFTISNSLIEGNTASGAHGAFGGGVSGSWDQPGNSSLARSIVRGNTVQPLSGSTTTTRVQGGGISVGYFASKLTVSDSTISGNTAAAASTGGAAIGGGILLSGQMTMTNSTLASNRSDGSTGYGGGVYSYGADNTIPLDATGNMQLFNSTISGNIAAVGGGVFLCARFGVFSSPAAIPTICAAGQPQVARMESTIVHGNGADVYAYQATSITGTNNITGSTTLAAVTGQQCNPNLTALADNNGPLVGSARKVGLSKAALQTRAIAEGSCAINQGNNPLGLPYDQRGNGFVRQIGGAVDVGAYEAKLRPTVTLNKVIVGTPPDAGRFNLSVTGGNPAGGNNPANNVGNGGTTGAVSVDDGALITLSETAAAGSSLGNYYVTLQCAGESGVLVGPSWSYQLGTTPPGEAPKNLTCTFFNRTKVPVNALLSGNGGGTVKSDLFGLSSSSQINCGATCSETFGAGIPITLTATPLAGSYFVGWSGGGCTGTGSCVVTPLAATTVTAQFNLIPRLTVTRIGAGTGSVRSDIAGIDCGASCAANFAVGTTVTLTATPVPGSNFVGWSGGACTGLGPCSVQMNAAQNVTAQFDPVQVPTLGAFGRVGLPLLLMIAAFALRSARRHT